MSELSFFHPPDDVVAAALHGLDLRSRFGRGGTEVGLARARSIIARTPLSLREMRVIGAWFARHGANRRSSIRPWGQDDDPSAAWIAWNLWGGDPGREWVDGVTGRLSAPIDASVIDDPHLARRLRELALV